MAVHSSGYLFSNWSHTEHCAPRNYYQPTSEDEVAQLVKLVESRGERLRVVGAGHAFSPLVLTGENLVNLDLLDKSTPPRPRCCCGAAADRNRSPFSQPALHQ